jgi:hypothetical protein
MVQISSRPCENSQHILKFAENGRAEPTFSRFSRFRSPKGLENSRMIFSDGINWEFSHGLQDLCTTSQTIESPRFSCCTNPLQTSLSGQPLQNAQPVFASAAKQSSLAAAQPGQAADDLRHLPSASAGLLRCARKDDEAGDRIITS